jgi:large subunit ribosomal protein L30
MAYLVVRMRGTVNIPYWANTTLESLNLVKKFRATIVPESDEYSGMLNRIRQLVAWCHVDNETVKDLLDKKGRKTASQPLKKTDLPKEYNSLDMPTMR